LSIKQKPYFIQYFKPTFNPTITMKKSTTTATILGLAFTLIAGTGMAQNRIAASSNFQNEDERNPMETLGNRHVGSAITVPGFCSTLNGFNVLDMGHDLVVLGWDATSTFASINIRWTLNGIHNFRTVTIAGAPNPGRYVVMGLNSTTTYDFQIQTVCTNGNISQWSRAITVTTMAPPAPRLSPVQSITRINITPNPATTSTTISWQDAIGTVNEISVLNSLGREVFKTAVVSTDVKSSLNLDLTGYSPGMYFVRMSNRAGVSSQRFMKL